MGLAQLARPIFITETLTLGSSGNGKERMTWSEGWRKDESVEIYPVRNNAPLLCSEDENYSFFSEHGVQSPV
jgi:hypothetical protein